MMRYVFDRESAHCTSTVINLMKFWGWALTLLGKFPKVICILALYNRRSVPWHTLEESEACGY